MGAQGRLVEVYDDTIVMIDTFLAKVQSVSDAAYDAQGHLRKEASITLLVYDGTSNKELTLTNGEDNYSYVKGDYVLLNAYTLPTNDSKVSGAVAYTGTEGTDYYGEIVAKAESFTGAQSVIYWNAQQHNVEGTVYDDAVKFYLDEAGNSTENHTWFLDQYGSLIGAADIAATDSYGVINRIWWGGNTADGPVKAVEVSGAGAYKNLHSENLAIYKDTHITSGLVANSNTVYLIRSGDDTTASPYTFKSVTGFDKIDRYQNDEVDYVMSDDFAKYVFIKADPTESKVTSVFFYAGEQASFNNETGVWTIPGYLDGEKTAIYAVGWNNSNVNTIIDTATGRGNANTIYSVALSNGYLDKDYTSAWVYTSTDPIRAASVNGVTYPLAAAYMNRNDVKVLTIQGSSSDTFEGNVYTHNDAKYSVVSNADFASKINGEFTNLGDKVIYLAYISGSGEYSGSILYANIVDAETTVPDPVNYKPTLTVTPVASDVNSVPSIDINGTTSIAVSHNTYKVTLNLNYKTGVGINSVAMKVNNEAVTLGGGSGTCTYVYTVNSADLLRQFITVDLTTSVDGGTTVKDSSSYKIAITGSLVEQ